ncbi:MAG TPA: tetratricopeptide repeat protein [Rickettsiales bacterium]|nr:tetratricopeptide repeat protein [Rickettsiales bacterium]
MRYLSLLLVLSLAATSLTGCNVGESEAAKANAKAMRENSSEISLKLAHASEAGGDFPSAEHYFKEAFSKDRSVKTRLELADFYRRHHGEHLALPLLKEAQKDYPDNTDVMREIANIYIGMGKPKDALDMLDQALETTSNDALLYNSKGVALDMLGRYTHARNAYSTALSLDPGNEMLFSANYAMSYILGRNYEKAIEILLPLARSPDSTPQVRQNLALAYGLKGDNDNALTYALKDLPPKQAQENVRFYNMLAKKGGVKNREAAIPPASTILSIPPIP